jgi:hypothetical protein
VRHVLDIGQVGDPLRRRDRELRRRAGERLAECDQCLTPLLSIGPRRTPIPPTHAWTGMSTAQPFVFA